jgi:hypothetical protein
LHLHFNRVARGPAWERWAMMEDQHGDMAFAGEIILTYMDNSVYADVECTVLFTRDLTDEEAEEALDSVCSILSGRGNIALHTAHEITCRGFSLMPEDDDEVENN